MSDKFKQFKNELIDLCEKYGYSIETQTQIEVYNYETGHWVSDITGKTNEETPKEDI